MIKFLFILDLGSSLSCIIVDDSLFVRKTLETMITGLGHNVVNAFSSGEEFIANLSTLDFDVMFLDIILPKISGLEVLQKTLELRPNSNIIMLSGLGEEDVINAALQLGAIDYLKKPVDAMQLRKVLETLVESFYIPDVTDLTTVAAYAKLISLFFEELLSISSPQVRKVIGTQLQSLFLAPPEPLPSMFAIDAENFSLKTKDEIWGQYEEEEILFSLKSLVEILNDELTYIYSEEYVEKLFQTAIATLMLKPRFSRLLSQVNPEVVNLPLPKIVKYETLKSSLETQSKLLEDNLLLATAFFGSMGPEIKNVLGNTEMLPDEEIMKASIFYFTLVGFGSEGMKGLFGPLPVSDYSDISAVFYSLYLKQSPQDPTPTSTIIILFYRFTADKLVDDFSRLNFIFKTRLGKVEYIADVTKVLLRGILEDLLEALHGLEGEN